MHLRVAEHRAHASPRRADDGFLAFEFMTIIRISVLYCTALIEAEAHSYV